MHAAAEGTSSRNEYPYSLASFGLEVGRPPPARQLTDGHSMTGGAPVVSPARNQMAGGHGAPPQVGGGHCSTEGQSLVRNASMARWRKVYTFPRPMMPRTRSRRWEGVPASVGLAKPAFAAI